MMNVGIWRTSFSCPVPLGEERSKTLELGIGSCYVVFWQRLWSPMKSIRFQNGLLWQVFLYYVENLFCVQPRLGMASRSCVEGMPCNSDLYVYLNIEVVIGLVQWSPFLRSQVVLQILWVVIKDGMSVVLSHSFVRMWWDHLVFGCSSLLLCIDLYTARYDLHFIKLC